MIGRIKCFFGFHKWKEDFVKVFSGFGWGNRCQRCGKWHPSAIRKPWKNEMEYYD